MKKIIKCLFGWIVFLLGGTGEITKDAVDAGILDLSGQGKDKYGR